MIHIYIYFNFNFKVLVCMVQCFMALMCCGSVKGEVLASFRVDDLVHPLYSLPPLLLCFQENLP